MTACSRAAARRSIARAAEILRDGASRQSRKRSPIISPKPASTIWRSNGGARRAIRRLRRSAFQEAIAHLGKAIAMADKGAGGKAAGVSEQRQHLHAAYGNALIATRGYGAPETTEAFVRANQSTADDRDVPDRLAADYGLWAGCFVRGELAAMRGRAAAFLDDVEARPKSPEACFAHRLLGATHWFAGEYREASGHLERALALFEAGRDDDLAFRFGQDAGVVTMLYLANALWVLGNVERAGALASVGEARIATLTHVSSCAYGRMLAAHIRI